mgnify:FL=1
MTKIGVVILVFVLLGIGIIFFNKQTNAPTIGEPKATPLPSGAKNINNEPQLFTVTYGVDGNMSPSELTIHVGDRVTFVNLDNKEHWPVSGPHPAHNICIGFGSLRGLKKNETYTNTFTVAKTCPFHDHLNAGDSGFKGQIIVVP